MAVAPSVISSRSNQRVKQLRAAFSGNRRLSGEFVAIEGEHLVEEAIKSGIEITTIFATPDRRLPSGVGNATEILRLSEDVFSSAVETRTPQGIAALIAPKTYEMAHLLTQPSPLIIMAAGLQDPGNLGTLIRSAEAFGASGIITTPGTVSEWNQKALRASVGSVFRLPVVAADELEIAELSRKGFKLYAAVGQQGAGVLPASEIDLSTSCVIMIGNEGSGLADVWLSMATSGITIPCPGPVESLNAAIAGSLLLYEASRQRSSLARKSSPTPQGIPNIQPRRPSGATR